MNNLNLLYLSGFILVIEIVKLFLPKYLGKKAENLATKQDVGEITSIVENIKKDLTLQTEFVKSKLSFNNQHKLNLKNEERNAIFNYNRWVSAWVLLFSKIKMDIYDLEDPLMLKALLLKLKNKQADLEIAEAHLFLFINDNSEFNDLNEALILKLRDSSNNLEQLKNNLEELGENQNEQNKNDFDNSRSIEIDQDFEKETSQLFKDYRKEAMIKIDQIKELHSKMINFLKNRLIQLDEEEK